MRLPSSYSTSTSDVSSSMTPMIDVVFQLLIYFLCTASFAMTEQILPTTLPPTGATTTTASLPPEVQELELIRIALSQRGQQLQIELNGSPCPDVANLRDRLRQLLALANLPAVLDVSLEVEIGHMINVYDTCRVVGVRDIHFAAPER
ncbi:MAG: biopolymer transporter ExbD [Planctomycetes bacterium]|nr:biopolymer transporter ExbD [Planctomycetota bacterium]